MRFHKNGNKKRAGVAIIISDKISFKIIGIIRDKKGLRNFTSGYLSKETKNNHSHRHVHSYVYCSSQYGNNLNAHQ